MINIAGRMLSSHAQEEWRQEYEMCMASVPDQLKALRIANGLSQQALADDLGATQGTISRYEAGHVSLVKLLDWCERLNVDLVVVPIEQAELQSEVATLLGTLNEAQRDEFLALIRSFVRAPDWARSTAATVMSNAVEQVSSKSA